VKQPNALRPTFRRISVGFITLGICCTAVVTANASLPGVPYLKPDILTSIAAAPGGGFWLQIQDDYAFSTPTPPGYTVPYEGAPAYDDVYHAGLIAAVPGTVGYWVVTRDGKINARGGAPTLCNGSLATCSGFSGNARSYLTARDSGRSDEMAKCGPPATQHRTAIPPLTMQPRRELPQRPPERVITSRSIMAVCILLATPFFTARREELSPMGIRSAALRRALTPLERSTDIGW
jgi:hypothetical protein